MHVSVGAIVFNVTHKHMHVSVGAIVFMCACKCVGAIVFCVCM